MAIGDIEAVHRIEGSGNGVDVFALFDHPEGVTYTVVSLDVDIEKKNYTQVFDIDFSGPMAFMRFSF